jgi:hypothetical protein
MYAFKLNLPNLPKKFESICLQKENLKLLGGLSNKKKQFYVDIDKKIKRGVTPTRYLIDSDLEHWIKENISDGHHQIIVATHENKNGSNLFAAHTDRTRSWVLIYYIRTGGKKATLNFYQEKNMNIIRELDISCRYKDLEKIESHCPKDGEWWLSNTMVLHDVQNIDSVRVAIQISFWNETVRSIKSQQIKHLF